MSVLKEHCSIIGRDYNEIDKSIVIRCSIRETEDELNRNIRKWKRKDETAKHFKKRIDTNIVLGTPDHVVSELKEYVSLGVTHFILHFVAFNIQCLKLFNSEVIKKI
jgi:alkanesulfonate monooxygenase SsuD/methylene tetrahydromethanopterin reductase-like flavin-dependent oxidoreductase (luciferase family)